MSPYSGYTGQLRGSVYQPTELAIISKAGGSVSTRTEEGVCVCVHIVLLKVCVMKGAYK